MAARRSVVFEDIWPKIDAVEGFLLPGQEEWLFRTTKSLPDGARIVEIGAYKGRSTLSLAYGCVGSRRHVFSIDKFQGVYPDLNGNDRLQAEFLKGFFDEWSGNLEANGLSQYATPLSGDSQEIVRIWKAPVHLLFIDGSHQYDDVMADFRGFYPYVVPGGIVALHDVTQKWEGPLRAWQECIQHELIRRGSISTLAFGRKPR